MVAKNGASVNAQAIIAHCSTRLPEAKVPKQVMFVEDIAKNERGKVDRNAMKALWVRSQGERRQK